MPIFGPHKLAHDSNVFILATAGDASPKRQNIIGIYQLRKMEQFCNAWCMAESNTSSTEPSNRETCWRKLGPIGSWWRRTLGRVPFFVIIYGFFLLHHSFRKGLQQLLENFFEWLRFQSPILPDKFTWNTCCGNIAASEYSMGLLTNALSCHLTVVPWKDRGRTSSVGF